MEPDYITVDEPTKLDKFKGKLAEFIEFTAILAAIFIALRLLIAEPHIVSGRSMVPNFQDKDYLITNKLVTYFSALKRGMVVILHDPANPSRNFIKRIVGLPGEKIKLMGGRVYINGNELPELYLPQGTITPGEGYLNESVEIIIPEDQYFVMGDNRGNSSDSRAWGPVKTNLIIGQAFFRYWPLGKIQYIFLGKVSD